MQTDQEMIRLSAEQLLQKANQLPLLPGVYLMHDRSGNVIYVNPEKDIAVSVGSYFKPTVLDRVDFIREYLEPFACE